MTPTRAQRQADATMAELDQVFAWIAGGPTIKNRDAHYAALRRRLHALICRDNISAGIDGYKSRHGSSDGGGNAELTAVEAAAFRLTTKGQPTDIVAVKVAVMVSSIGQMRDNAVSVDNAARLLPAEPGAPAPTAALCSHCALEPGDRETDVNGALPGARFLCQTCITFVEQQGGKQIGRHRPRLPNELELKARQLGKRPKATVNPKAGPWQWRDGSTTGTSLPPDNAA